MSSSARRRTARELRRARRRAQQELRESLEARGISKPSHPTRPNRTSPHETVEEEGQARTDAVVEQARLIRQQLPTLLEELSKIPEPRNPERIEHTLTSLMVYGILMFALQMGSRRRTNESMSAPAMKEALQGLFPELETIPHHDTLYRLLACIDPRAIEKAQVGLVRSLIRDKKFVDYLVEGHYLIAFDGTQKMVRRMLPDDGWLQRQVGAEPKKWTQYYLYVLEANLVLSNGVSIPLMSEFLDYREGDSEWEKQDCELRAFYRLARRLKLAFPRLPIMLLLDGLFASGPVMDRCRSYKWHFMIVLQDKSLPQVWQECAGLRKLLEAEDRLKLRWADREQSYELFNHIEYRWGENGRKSLLIHVALCQESWEGVDEKGKKVKRSSRWAWLSDLPFSAPKVHERCNLGGRHRWAIEEGFLVEKRQGYEYEHCYALDWKAMCGYHYLMRLGHLLNVLVTYASTLIEAIKERGAQGFIEWVRGTLSGRWLKAEELRARLEAPFQLRLLFPLPAPPALLSG